MKTIVISCMVAMVCLVLVAPYISQRNIVPNVPLVYAQTTYTNDGFEDFLTGWTSDSGNGGTILKSGEQKLNGSYSAVCNSTASSSHAYAYNNTASISVNFHYSIWIYAPSGFTQYGIVVAEAYDTAGCLVWQLRIWSNSTGYYLSLGGSPPSNVTLINQDTWVHIEAYYIRASGILRIYVDGIKIGGNWTTNVNINRNPDRFYIGDVSAITTTQSNGKLFYDDLLVDDAAEPDGGEYPYPPTVMTVEQYESGGWLLRDSGSYTNSSVVTQIGGNTLMANESVRLNLTQTVSNIELNCTPDLTLSLQYVNISGYGMTPITNALMTYVSSVYYTNYSVLDSYYIINQTAFPSYGIVYDIGITSYIPNGTTFYTYNPYGDTSIHQNQPNTNFGDHVLMEIMQPGGAWLEDRILMGFYVPITDLPLNSTILNATFGMYYYMFTGSDPVGRIMILYNVQPYSSNWVESIATWNIATTGQSWRVAGGDVFDLYYSTAVIPASYAVWMTWNVTDESQWCFDNSASPSGVCVEFIIRDNAGNLTNEFIPNFYSKEEGTPYIPYLNLTAQNYAITIWNMQLGTYQLISGIVMATYFFVIGISMFMIPMIAIVWRRPGIATIVVLLFVAVIGVALALAGLYM